MKECTNPACSMNGQSVDTDTDRFTCAGCGRSLTSSLGGLFDSLLGHRTGSSPTVPAEVLTALREADDLLSKFNAGAPVRRSEITTVLAKTSGALRRFG